MHMQYTAIFHGCKNVHFQMKMFNIFLIFAQNIDCGYTLEPPQRGGSNEYPQSMFWSKNKKNVCYYQRTNGPVNAHLISWPSKAQNIQNLEKYVERNDLNLQYSHTFIISISCL